MIIPLEEIRARLAYPPQEDSHLLTDLAERAIAYLEQRTGMYLGEPREVVEHIAPGGWLSSTPTGDVTLERRTHIGGEWEAVPTTDYEVRGRRIYYGPYVHVWEARATYEAGYEPGFDPPDIRGAALDLVAMWYEAGAVVIDGAAQTLPHSVTEVINSRRRMPV